MTSQPGLSALTCCHGRHVCNNCIVTSVPLVVELQLPGEPKQSSECIYYFKPLEVDREHDSHEVKNNTTNITTNITTTSATNNYINKIQYYFNFIVICHINSLYLYNFIAIVRPFCYKEHNCFLRGEVFFYLLREEFYLLTHGERRE